MDDFSTQGFNNSFDLQPTTANMIAPGKRPLSSVCPSIITDENGKIRLLIGATNGPKIPTGVAQASLNYIH